ncbi:hypothetical protein ABPG74_013967 [Tetrahymena malaccensis]
MSIDANLKNKFKQNNTFSIYNIYKNLNVDIETKFYHLNFNKNQTFRFQVSSKTTSSEYLLGNIVHAEKIIAFDQAGNAKYISYYSSNESDPNIALLKNEQGLFSIHPYQSSQVKQPISLKNKNSEQGYITPSFEWYFLQKQTSDFENKSIIITSLKNQNYAISSKSGGRFVELELFDMYNKQDFTFKAKISDKSKNYFCLEQISGENCMTATNKIVQNQPFQKEVSEWTIIKNFAKEEYFFLSMKQFTYLTNNPEPAGLTLEQAKLYSGNQSFKIDDFGQRNLKIQNQQSDENIEEESFNHGQMNQINEIEPRFKMANTVNQSVYNQSYLAKNGQNSINYYQQQQNQISQSVQQPPQQKANNIGGLLHSVDIFKSNSNNQQNQQKLGEQQHQIQYQRFKLVNRASKQYLRVNSNEVIETSDASQATPFIFIPINSEFYIALDNQKILGSYSDTPVTPIKVLERSSYPQQKFKIQTLKDQSIIIQSNNFSFQIIGGKLYKSELQLNEYCAFNKQIV